MSHTPEPIEVTILPSGAFHITNSSNAPRSVAEQGELAARIKACINGCTGLNPAAYRDVVEALQHALLIFGTPSNGVYRVPAEPVLTETLNTFKQALALATEQP